MFSYNEDFEAWAKANGFDIARNNTSLMPTMPYLSNHTCYAWEAWQGTLSDWVMFYVYINKGFKQ